MSFTPETANAILHDVRRRLVDLQEAYALVVGTQERMEHLSGSNGGGKGTDEFLKASMRVVEHLQWFAQRGIVLRDIAQGLIDFPSERDGGEIFLCWRLGEDAVGFWHEVDTGFAGRRPLE